MMQQLPSHCGALTQGTWLHHLCRDRWASDPNGSCNCGRTHRSLLTVRMLCLTSLSNQRRSSCVHSVCGVAATARFDRHLAWTRPVWHSVAGALWHQECYECAVAAVRAQAVPDLQSGGPQLDGVTTGLFESALGISLHLKKVPAQAHACPLVARAMQRDAMCKGYPALHERVWKPMVILTTLCYSCASSCMVGARHGAHADTVWP